MQLTEKEAVHNYYALKELLMREGDFFGAKHVEKLESDLATLEGAVKSFKNGEYTELKISVVLKTFDFLIAHFEKLPGKTIGLKQGEKSDYGLVLKIYQDIHKNLFSKTDTIQISTYTSDEPSMQKMDLLRGIYIIISKMENSPPENFIELVEEIERSFFRIGLIGSSENKEK